MSAVGNHVLKVFELGSRVKVGWVAAPAIAASVIHLLTAKVTLKKLVSETVGCLNPFVPIQLTVTRTTNA